MSLNNILVLSQATGYAIALLLSLCIVVPLSLNVENFKGHCLLFTNGSFSTSDASLVPNWASPHYCSFSLFVGNLSLCISIIQLTRMSIFLCRDVDSSFFSAFLDTILSLLVTALVFVAAVMISRGFATWCSTVTKRFPSCDDASNSILFPNDKTGMKTFGFYIEMGTAQFGAWCSLVIWVTLSVFTMRKLCRFHEEENVRVSMLRERQRLMNSGSTPTGSLYSEIAS